MACDVSTFESLDSSVSILLAQYQNSGNQSQYQLFLNRLLEIENGWYNGDTSVCDSLQALHDELVMLNSGYAGSPASSGFNSQYAALLEQAESLYKAARANESFASQSADGWVRVWNLVQGEGFTNKWTPYRESIDDAKAKFESGNYWAAMTELKAVIEALGGTPVGGALSIPANDPALISLEQEVKARLQEINNEFVKPVSNGLKYTLCGIAFVAVVVIAIKASK